MATIANTPLDTLQLIYGNQVGFNAAPADTNVADTILTTLADAASHNPNIPADSSGSTGGNLGLSSEILSLLQSPADQNLSLANSFAPSASDNEDLFANALAARSTAINLTAALYGTQQKAANATTQPAASTSLQT